MCEDNISLTAKYLWEYISNNATDHSHMNDNLKQNVSCV